MLNSSVTGFCFESKLGKSSDDLFFRRYKGKLEAFTKTYVTVSLEILYKDPSIRALQKTGSLEITQRNL